MRILVSVKRVPSPGARIPITPDGLAVDAAQLGFTISPHEECAVEEAVRLVERHGGDSTVITLGPPQAEEQLRYALSLGADHAMLLPTDGADWDPQRTAAAITTAVRALEERSGTFDLLLFGNESADAGGHQVGIRVATALGRPMVNGVKSIDVADDIVTAGRPTAGATERYELPLPAVLGVKEGINLPRYPTIRGRLKSKRAQVDTGDPSSATPGGLTLRRLLPAREEVSETEIVGSGAGAAPRVVEILAELGLLR
jgi:electron transfer flavoprotein beta subunit